VWRFGCGFALSDSSVMPLQVDFSVGRSTGQERARRGGGKTNPFFTNYQLCRHLDTNNSSAMDCAQVWPPGGRLFVLISVESRTSHSIRVHIQSHDILKLILEVHASSTINYVSLCATYFIGKTERLYSNFCRTRVLPCTANRSFTKYNINTAPIGCIQHFRLPTYNIFSDLLINESTS
jgi:hypothetical protein